MVGSVTLRGWPEADMDFWWRGRAEGTAEVTAAPAEDMLLTDISVRLSTENSWEDHGNARKKSCSSLRLKNSVFKQLSRLTPFMSETLLQEMNISGVNSD